LLLAGLDPATAQGSERETAKAQRLAAKHGFERVAIDAAPFEIAGFLKGRSQAGDVLLVVIEGDGYAFRGPREPSNDPTPFDPVGLEIALADPAPKILALARPCQYQRKPPRSECAEARWWTTDRFAPAAVEATGRAIDIAKAETRARQIYLVGWSGGGVMAVLVAAQRGDVAGLVTVAAPLDLSAWTAHHGVSGLARSRDPADVIAAVAGIPQAHLAGTRDAIVPPAIVRRFTDRLPMGSDERLILVDADHRCCWVERWRTLRAGLPLPR
jgi:pimeloyl-ACP methyl ester carboxylesterase